MPLHKVKAGVEQIRRGVLPNHRRELFCQFIANGRPLDDAYVLAGYEPHRGNATAMRAQPDVAHRINEIMEAREKRGAEIPIAAAAVREVSKEWVMAKLIENAECALKREDGSVANRALELIGKQLGMFIERTEIGRAGEFENLSVGQLRRELLEQARELGLHAELLLEDQTIEGEVVDDDEVNGANGADKTSGEGE
jgi:phage terminase small subunit